MEKPPNFNKMNDSNLIQLANRVGRDPSKIPYAFVYVNSLDAPHVAEALNSDPSTFTDKLNYSQIQKGLRSNCNIDGFLQYFKLL